MLNANFVHYLNTLHNVGANNENAIAEAQQSNPLFSKIFVERPMGRCLEEHLTNQSGRLVLLTGHAGDGKTSLLLQLLKGWGKDVERAMQQYAIITLPSGKRIRYIKDFSELSTENQKVLLQASLDGTKEGESTILIANTGPLLKTIRSVLGETAEMKVINAIDENNAEPCDIAGYDVLALNIAGIDNTSFVRPFLNKVLADDCWSSCETCPQTGICPILFNRNLVKENFEKATGFITEHYIWQQEHGRRLTIRQITAHLAYALTGGLQCESIVSGQGRNMRFQYLFSNLFFGLKETMLHPEALQLEAIRDIHTLRYDQKRLFVEEELFIRREFSKITKELGSMIKEIGESCRDEEEIRGWQAAVKRMYILFNIETDSNSVERMKKNLFSRMFPRYLAMRQGTNSGLVEEKKLVREALAIMFTGFIDRQNRRVPLTMRRETGVLQNVQLSYGVVAEREIQLKTENHAVACFDEDRHQILRLTLRREAIAQPLNLPLLNYFDDLRQGILSTNVDPQLTHGIDSIKAQTLRICQDSEIDDAMELMILNGDKWDDIRLCYEEGGWRIQ